MDSNEIQKSKLLSVSLAHMFNDWYMNLISTLLPFFVASGLGVGRCAILVSAFTVTSSVLQPLFGYLVDQKNQRWMVYAGTIWMAVLLSMIGVTDNYALMVAIALLSGLGTAAFHPQASAMISMISGSRKGFAQSIFSAAGNVGWALTPLLVIPIVSVYGLGSTPVLIVPGIIVAVLLWFYAPEIPVGKDIAPSPVLPVLKKNWPELAKIVFVVACRSLTYFGLISFLPLYFQSRNMSVANGGYLLFVMLFSGAIGGIVGGYASDRVGRKAVVVCSLMLASPLFMMFMLSEGVAKNLFLALAGACLLASFSVTVVQAQEIISKNAALASGLTLGFGIGIGGLGVGVVGVVIENFGLVRALGFLIWMPLLAGAAALSMKSGGVKNISPALSVSAEGAADWNVADKA